MGYGAAEFSSSLTWTMLAVLFLFFLTDVVGMDPAFAGLVMMIGTLWDAVTDPTVGILSDRMRTRWGRRRPFLLAIAVPYGLITWLLFTDFGLGPSLTKWYFVMAIVLYYTAATLLEVPYASLAAEMTQDYDERTSLFSFRAAFSQLASIAGAGLPWLMIAYFSKTIGGEKARANIMPGLARGRRPAPRRDSATMPSRYCVYVDAETKEVRDATLGGDGCDAVAPHPPAVRGKPRRGDHG